MKHLYIFIITLAFVTTITIYSVSSSASADFVYTKTEYLPPIENIVLTEAEETTIEEVTELHIEEININVEETLNVPFYSQFTDITPPQWKKVGCGIASLAMLIDYYQPSPPSVDTLLQEGIEASAYLNNAGWTYAGLIGVSKKYGFTGSSYDLASDSMENAFNSLVSALKDGPVMVSVHYKFEPTNPIPHLVVANEVRDGMIYYNDPAAETGNLSLPISVFKQAWKKRYIEIRPVS